MELDPQVCAWTALRRRAVEVLGQQLQDGTERVADAIRYQIHVGLLAMPVWLE